MKKLIIASVFTLSIFVALPQSAEASIWSDFFNFFFPATNSVIRPQNATSAISLSGTSATLGTSITDPTAKTNMIIGQAFTLAFTINAADAPLYISANPKVALSTTHTGFVRSEEISIPQAGVRANPASVSGDTNVSDPAGYYIIPAGTSRTFKYEGALDGRNLPPGAKTFRVLGINFGTTPEKLSSDSFKVSPNELSIKVNMGQMGGKVEGSKTPMPTPTVSSKPKPTDSISYPPKITSVFGKATGENEIDACGIAGIQGLDLVGSNGQTYVYIDQQQSSVTQYGNNLLYVKTPCALTAGNTYDLFIKNDKGTSNTVKVRVISSRSTSQGTFSISPAFPNASVEVNSRYSQTFTIVGAQKDESFKWMITKGEVPPGITMTSDSSKAVLSGYPTRTGGYNFSIAAISDRGRTATVIVRLSVTSGSNPVALHPTPRVVWPNGGEEMRPGGGGTVLWYGGGNGEKIRFDLVNVTTGVSYWIVNDVTPSSNPAYYNGSVSWSVPSNVKAGEYKVRITRQSDGKVLDESDRSFTVLEPLKGIGVVRPTYGESYYPGQVMNIQFQPHNFTGDQVYTLELISWPGYGTTLTTVQPIYSTKQTSYAWTVPSNLSANLRYGIKVCPVGFSQDLCSHSEFVRVNPTTSPTPTPSPTGY